MYFKKPMAMNDRRVSLANVVNAQIELKRQSDANYKTLTRFNNNNNNLSSAMRIDSLTSNTSRNTSIDYNKIFKDHNNSRKNSPVDIMATINKNRFSFFTSTSSLTPKTQLVNKEHKNYLSSSKWSLDNGKESGTYGSLVNRLAESVGESETLFDFLKKAITILYHTVAATILILGLILYHLAELSMGLKHLNDCPKQPKIPVYLFVGGCIGLLKSLHLIWNQMSKSSRQNGSNPESSMGHSTGIDDTDDINEELSLSKGSKFTDCLLSIFLTIWFGFGNYWILSIYEPRYVPLLREPNNWCYKNLYTFALVHLLVYYVLSILAIIIIFLLTVFTQIPYLIMKFQEC